MSWKELFPGVTGRLIPLLEEDEVTDILINGVRDVVVEKAGVLETRAPLFEEECELTSLIERMCLPIGKRTDARHPFLDGVLPEGSRFHIILPPLVQGAAHISIRRHSHAGRFTLVDFGEGKTLKLLRDAIGNRENLLIAGGTGSGKTSLVSALLDQVPPSERIIVIEETREIRTIHPHVVSLEARPPSVEGVGEVTLRTLIRTALRMRPDRILLGECRGDEAADLIQVMNTGHPGSFSTLHANGCLDALRRLETLILLSGYRGDVSGLRQHVASALNLVVYLRRSGSERKVAEIVRVCGTEGGQYRFAPILKLTPSASC